MISLAGIFIICTIHLSTVSDESSLPPEAIKSWEIYSKLATNVCGTRNGTVYVNGTLRNTNSESYKFGESNSIIYAVQAASPNSKYADDIYVVNNNYGFQLTKNKSNGKLMPTDIRKLDHTGYLITPLKFDPRIRMRTYLQSIVSTLPLSGQNLLTLENTYIIKNSKVVAVQEMVEYEAELEYKASSAEEKLKSVPSRPLIRFKATLNPKHYWRIEKYSYDRIISKDIIEKANGVVKYTNLSSSLIVPTEIRHNTSFPNDVNMKIEHLEKFNLHEEKPSPETDFLLSAFGFPEPHWTTSSPDSRLPWHLIISIVGIACLILACYLQFRRSKVAI